MNTMRRALNAVPELQAVQKAGPEHPGREGQASWIHGTACKNPGTAPRKTVFPAVSILTLALWLTAAGLVLAGNGGRMLRIRSAPVRSKPSFETGSREGTIYFGQSCEIVKRSPDWIKIEWTFPPDPEGKSSKAQKDRKTETRSGWVHETAFYATAPAEKSSRPVSEWVLKGAKGLAENKPGKQVENFIRTRHLDLKPVLKLESGYPSARATEEFMRKGRLGLFREDWPSLIEGVESKKKTKGTKP